MTKKDVTSKPGPGGWIPGYTDKQLIKEVTKQASRGQHAVVEQLSREMARRCRGRDR